MRGFVEIAGFHATFHWDGGHNDLVDVNCTALVVARPPRMVVELAIPLVLQNLLHHLLITQLRGRIINLLLVVDDVRDEGVAVIFHVVILLELRARSPARPLAG